MNKFINFYKYDEVEIEVCITLKTHIYNNVYSLHHVYMHGWIK